MSEEDYLLEKVELAKKITRDCAEFLVRVGHDSIALNAETNDAVVTTDKNGRVCYGTTIAVNVQSWNEDDDDE